MKQITLPISGMTCASCVARLENGLSKVAGVDKASINFATERATIEYEDNVLDVPKLVEAVSAIGYNVPTEKITLPVTGMTCASCVEKIQKALRRVNGVVTANVNLA